MVHSAFYSFPPCFPPSITNFLRLRCMRPLVSFSTFFTFFLAVAFVAADHQEIIDNQDSRIYYSGDWKIKDIPGGDGRKWSFNDKASATASLKVYNASRIAVSVFVEKLGQMVGISLDSQYYDIEPSIYQQPAWTSDPLDHGVPHDLQIIKRNDAGQYIGIDYIQVTYYDPPTSTGERPTSTAAQTPAVTKLMPPVASPTAYPAAASTSTRAKPTSGVSLSGPFPPDSGPVESTSDAFSGTKPSTNSDGSGVPNRVTHSIGQPDPSALDSFTSLLIPEASSTFTAQQSNTGPVLSGGKLAGVILACLAAPALIIAGIILYRRKKVGKRKAASTAYLEWMAAHGYPPPHPPFSPTPRDEKFDVECLTQPESPTDDSTDPLAVAVVL